MLTRRGQHREWRGEQISGRVDERDSRGHLERAASAEAPTQISVVKSIKNLLPQLQANLPTGIQLTILTDLTTSIESSVSDVEFELMLTVGLVVMVIFLFLRNLYATIIPSVAVPLS